MAELLTRPCSRLCAALLAAMSACAGTGGRQPSSGPDDGGTIRVGLPELGALDPARATGASSLTVLKAACDAVTSLNPISGEPEPALAKKWSFSAGAQKLSVQLKTGLRFDDGAPVNSQAVRESLSRVARPATASPWSGLVGKIAGFAEVQSGAATHLSGVKTLSSSRLEIELTDAFSDLPTVLAHPGLTPVSPKSLAAAVEAPEAPVCSGPYQIEQQEPGTDLRLVRRKPVPEKGEDGAAAKASLRMASVVVVKGFDTQADAYAAFESGEVDVAPVPEGEISDEEAPKGYERRAGTQTALLAFDATRFPTDDPRLRQAISLALDRLVIIDAAFPDQRPPALRWLPPNFGSEAGPACAQLIRKVSDPERAKERLAGTGPETKPAIPLIFDTAQFGRLVAQAIQVQVKDVLGITLEPEPMDAAEFEASVKNRPSPAIWLMNTSVELPIPDEIIGGLFATGSAKNSMGFSAPDVDAAIEKARKATEQSEAVRLWIHAEDEVCEKMPAIPMWRASAQWIRNPDKVTLEGEGMLDASGSPVLRALSGASR